MTFLAPFTSLMRIGQGFNSYTQQICIDDAVLVHEYFDSPGSQLRYLPGQFPPDNVDGSEKDIGDAVVEGATEPADDSLELPRPTATEKVKSSNVNQTVTYTAHAIDNLADVVDTLNISSSATINYANSHSNGSASFVKENNISESDINFIVSVKVTNELPIYPTHLEFRPLDGLEPDHFSEVYGDCFIAGFLEGGEFSAIVSIKVQDKNKISRVKMAAEMQLSATKYFQPLSGTVADREKEDIWTDTDLSISVTWSGGGNIKKPKASWDLPTIIQAANDFPAQVSKYSQRTQAILMSYNSVRSFHEFNAKAARPFVVLDYRLCELYTAELLMIKTPDLYQAKEATDKVRNPIDCDPTSLNQAKIDCRKGMTMILEETKMLARKPHLGMVDEHGAVRVLPCGYASELAARLPTYIGSSKNGEHDRPSRGALVLDEMNVVNKYASSPSFLPHLGDNQGAKLPRVTNTFYSTASNTSPDRQLEYDINHPTRAIENPAAENTDGNWGQMRPRRSCMHAPGFIAAASLRWIGLGYRALLLQCCFQKTKKVKLRTPRVNSGQEEPVRGEQVAAASGEVIPAEI
ncbi:hypothetical protein AJ78_03040 [Emergomyces pasteurianus Ep9510]|uniref:Uncharacterized protein n=1 Tax=Emergomyces pasteurianus Ep9510 TaxID=1447872 RepID=A0A1J9PLU0_9EURO|nr:hypothetical protein AJ78_03040 [Emergomyces pasteurianus Ep9510]